MKLVAIDIETLDVERDTALVFEIGVASAEVSESGVTRVGVSVLHPDMCQQLVYGHTVSQRTIDWHVQQHLGNRAEFAERLQQACPPNAKSIDEVYHELSALVQDADEIWINGLSFDPIVLHHLFKIDGRTVPWDFRMERDVRTIRSALSAIGFSTDGTVTGKRHTASVDAQWNLEMAIGYHTQAIDILKHHTKLLDVLKTEVTNNV